MICRRMRWTWQQYRSQPKWFIDILELMNGLDDQKLRAELDKQEAKSKMAEAKARGRR